MTAIQNVPGPIITISRRAYRPDAPGKPSAARDGHRRAARSHDEEHATGSYSYLLQ